MKNTKYHNYMPVLLFDFLAFSFKAFVFGLSGGRPLLFGNCGSCWVIFGTDTLIEVNVCVDCIFVSRESPGEVLCDVTDDL
ncbi:hypothetical protein BpHYR1_028800 [Brachionus plicatilis]|uniref:Uncharacterized protein n=1 Tax=Brachionus plicatilis TaxID=10195 RepID=A0A3M7P967_BRAPC|nr:hypothetical protein BpHYR1_028800 [Brachionus plicatilis]